MKLVRTFHPVGHGAFYTERFYDDYNQNVANIVYDCGRFETAKENWFPQKYKVWIEDYVKTQSGFQRNDVIDVLFISHFHTDHINGVDYLLDNFDVKKVVMPAITALSVVDSVVYADRLGGYVDDIINFFEKCISGSYLDKVCEVSMDIEDEDFYGSEDRFPKGNIENLKCIDKPLALVVNSAQVWKYIPFYKVDIAKKNKLESKLRTVFPSIVVDGKIDRLLLLKELKKSGVRSFKSVYESVFGQDKHNSYSMTLFSGIYCDKRCFDDCHLKIPAPCFRKESPSNSQYCSVNCLYMGDYEALGMGLDSLKIFYGNFWKYIGVLQVPHHGSEHNSDENIYDRERLCIISCDSHDKYGHPDPSVLSAIRDKSSISLIVTELPMTKQVFVINFPDCL